MNNSPFFSIIVPIYQSKDWIIETVNSIQRQSFTNIEILLVDDGSSDGSSKICDELSRKDQRITVIHQKNQGVSSARNTGIKNSHGRWIIFIDSDDLVSQFMCEIFFHHIKENYLYDFIAGNLTKSYNDLKIKVKKDNNILYTTSKNKNISLIKQMLLSDFSESPESFRTEFGNNVILNSVCAKAYKSDFIKKNNILFNKDIKYSEDLLFNIEILSYNARGIYVNDKVYFYRDNSFSITNKKYIPNILENYLYFKKRIYSLIKKQNIPDLKKATDVYCYRNALLIMPSDIFNINNSFSSCYKRFKEIMHLKFFDFLINWEILDDCNEYLSKKELLKGELLLKRKFLILYFWYKILKK